MKALKDAGKTVYAVVQGVEKEAVTEVIKRGWKLATKKIGLEVTKKVGSAIANELVNIGIDKTLIPLIEGAIKQLIAPMIISALEKNKNVKQWLQIDANNRNAHYQSIILNLAMKCLSNESTKGTLRRLAEGIGDRVASTKSFKSTHLGFESETVGEIYNFLKKGYNLQDVTLFTNKFLKSLKNPSKRKRKTSTKQKQLVQMAPKFIKVNLNDFFPNSNFYILQTLKK